MKTLAICFFITLFPCAIVSSAQVVVKGKSKISGFECQDCFAVGAGKALNTTTGETLVIWQEQYNDVKGVIISPTGRVKTKPFYISSSAEGLTSGSTVAYNPVTKEFLVVYSLFQGGSILATRLDSQGKAVGKEFTVIPVSSSHANAFPHVIYDLQTNGYVLVWERTEGIAAALLDQSGKLTGSILIVKKNPGSNGYYDDQRTFDGRIFDVEWLQPANKVLVVFQQRFTDQPPPPTGIGAPGGQADDWLATLSPKLKPFSITKINKTPISLNAWGNWLASLSILQDGSAIVFYADDQSVKRRKIDQRGKLTGPPSQAFSGTTNQPLHNPTAEFSTTSKGTVGLLMAYEIVPHGLATAYVWAQTLDPQGRPAGAAKAVDRVIAAQATTSVLIALPRKPSDTLFPFLWFQARNNPAPPSMVKLKLQVVP